MADLNSIGGIHYEMMKRCYNHNSISYKDYGGKGIKVCNEWHDRNAFRLWANNNGYKKGLRLERIDSKLDYGPENCKFGNKQVKHRHTSDIKRHRKQMYLLSDASKGYSKERLYGIFRGMHTRCELKSYSNYFHYGGRGICVCDMWSGKDGYFYFRKWAYENGYSDKFTLDRINPNGNYEPSNCRWADWNTQANNKRNSIKVEYQGKEMTIKAIADMYNISYGKLYIRLKKKMSVDDALEDIFSKTILK